MRAALLLLLALVPCLLAFRAPGRADAFDDGFDAAAARVVEKLEDLAARANKARLYLERDRIYERVLVLAPDNKRARHGLGFRKNGDGEWERSRDYREPRDYAEGELPAFRDERKGLQGEFRMEVLRLLTVHASEMTHSRRWEVLHRLLALEQNDEIVQGMLGAVRAQDGRWLLVESRDALERRARIETEAEQHFRAVPPPEPSEPVDFELAMGIDWVAGLRTERVRVMGAVARSEIHRATVAIHAAGDLFRWVFGVDTPHRDGFTVYLFETPDDRDRFLGNYPGLASGAVARLRTLGGGPIGDTNVFGQWTHEPEMRVDGVVRQTFGGLLTDAFGITTKHGWAWEGFGLYLNHQLIGTRLSFFVRDTGYVPDAARTMRTRLRQQDADWLAMALEMMRGEHKPKLSFVLGSDVNGMNNDDMLLAFALAAYLIESQPTKVPRILGRIGGALAEDGQGENPIIVLQGELGWDLPHLEARLMRWLEEVSGP